MILFKIVYVLPNSDEVPSRRKVKYNIKPCGVHTFNGNPLPPGIK